MPLNVKKLDPNAILPTVANPGEDLGYDLYALEDTKLIPNVPTKVRTGIAAVFTFYFDPYGLMIRDRSSMASNGVTVSGGIVDSGYRGELKVILTWNGVQAGSTQIIDPFYEIKAGDKIAQMIPIMVLTDNGAAEVTELPPSARGTNGFGSSGK